MSESKKSDGSNRTLTNKARRIAKDQKVKQEYRMRRLARSYHDDNTAALDALGTMAYQQIMARKKANKRRREEKFIQHVKSMKDLAARMFSIESRAVLREAA